MSETNDMKAAAVDDEQLPLGDSEAEVTGAESSLFVGKADSGADDIARPKKPNRKAPSKSAKPRAAKNSKCKEETPGAAPPSLRDRLLAPIKLPPVRIDSRSLPPELHEALDTAGLADVDNLPTATFSTLAAIAAVAGPSINCTLEKPLPGLNTLAGLSLRLAIVSEQRTAPLVPPCITGAAYAAEGDALDAHNVEVARIEETRRKNAQRHRVREQAAQAGIDLGANSSAPDDAPDKPRPRPRVVALNGAASAIRIAAAGGTGVFVIDERRLPWLANVGGNFDLMTDALLNAAAAGHQIPIEDPTSGRVTMRVFPVGVIGILNFDDCDTLHKANRAQLGATVFMPAAAPPPNGDHTKLDDLMRRVYQLGLEGLTLRLPATDVLASATKAWTTAAADVQPPAADFLASAPDLARRIAALLYLASINTGVTGSVIPAKVVSRAVRLVDDIIVPTARALLEPFSTSQAERDARRIVGHLRAHQSPADRLFERRSLLRSWQRTITTIRLDAAIGVLRDAELLTPATDGDGRIFEVADAVFGEV